MSTKVTKHHIEAIRERLPHRYVEELTRKVNEKITDGKTVSEALVSAVMKGHKNDYHNIIDTALTWAKEIEENYSKILEEAKA